MKATSNVVTIEPLHWECEDERLVPGPVQLTSTPASTRSGEIKRAVRIQFAGNAAVVPMDALRRAIDGVDHDY